MFERRPEIGLDRFAHLDGDRAREDHVPVVEPLREQLRRRPRATARPADDARSRRRRRRDRSTGLRTRRGKSTAAWSPPLAAGASLRARRRSAGAPDGRRTVGRHRRRSRLRLRRSGAATPRTTSAWRDGSRWPSTPPSAVGDPARRSRAGRFAGDAALRGRRGQHATACSGGRTTRTRPRRSRSSIDGEPVGHAELGAFRIDVAAQPRRRRCGAQCGSSSASVPITSIGCRDAAPVSRSASATRRSRRRGARVCPSVRPRRSPGPLPPEVLALLARYRQRATPTPSSGTTRSSPTASRISGSCSSVGRARLRRSTATSHSSRSSGYAPRSSSRTSPRERRGRARGQGPVGRPELCGRGVRDRRPPRDPPGARRARTVPRVRLLQGVQHRDPERCLPSARDPDARLRLLRRPARDRLRRTTARASSRARCPRSVATSPRTAGPQPVAFHEGFFSDTLGGFTEPTFMCLWMDVDLESSSEDVMAVLPRLDRRGVLFSHECPADLFTDSGVHAPRSPEQVVPPILDAFAAAGRRVAARHVHGHTGAFWDADAGIAPLPTSALLALRDLAMSLYVPAPRPCLTEAGRPRRVRAARRAAGSCRCRSPRRRVPPRPR